MMFEIMAKYFFKRKRQCPGDGYEISVSVCRGRQRVLYPKCPVCQHRDKTIGTLTEEETDKTGSLFISQAPKK